MRISLTATMAAVVLAFGVWSCPVLAQEYPAEWSSMSLADLTTLFLQARSWGLSNDEQARRIARYTAQRYGALAASE